MKYLILDAGSGRVVFSTNASWIAEEVFKQWTTPYGVYKLVMK